jgi:16S rRNA (guanine527-N7)-methyltransferase
MGYERDFMDDIKTALDDFGIENSPLQIEQLSIFKEAILNYNDHLKLVSRTDPEREIIKQITDSMVLIKFHDLIGRGSLLDIGSGGGFPGMVIKIMRPEIKLITLDSSPRKITFQRDITLKLGLRHCEFVDSQLSEYHPAIKIDYITSKAFGKFKKVLSFGRNNLNDSGCIIFFLGESIPKELSDLSSTSFTAEAEYPYNLPGSNTQSRLFIIKKSV